MFKNYLKIALRNILWQKGYSFINIFGLAIGIAACLLISLWVRDELNFDKFNENSADLYQIIQTQYYPSGPFTVGAMPGPIVGHLKESFPEVVDATHFGFTSVVLTKGENRFQESVTVADNALFSIFTFPIIAGEKDKPLTDPHSIVLTKKSALKYFGIENPVGETITVSNKHEFTVTAIVDDIPHDSSLQFDLVIPFEFLRERGQDIDGWNNNHRVYLQLQPNTDYLDKKIEHFLPVIRNDDTDTILFLFPYLKKHLFSATGGQDGMNAVYLISLIALLILLIACINYMNLATARSARRAREVGLRKVMGASRSQLSRQFLWESVLLALFAMALALVLVELVLPYFSTFAQKELNLGFNLFSILIVTLVIVFTGLIAGSYPAFMLSSFQPIKVLKSSITSGKNGSLFRKLLVILQFSLSIVLIISTLTIYNQLSYMRDKKIGLDKEDVIYIRSNNVLREKYLTLKSELLKQPDILSVTGTANLPTGIWSNGSGWTWEGKDPEFQPLITNCSITSDFAKTMNMKVISGRDLNSDSDKPEREFQEVLINQTMADIMQLENPIGENVQIGEYDLEIVGLLEDFNFKPLSYKIEPLIMFNSPNSVSYYMIKYNGRSQKDVMTFLENTLNDINPGFPVSISFLDNRYNRMYIDEKKFATLFNSFAALAILISCLGLFGLSSFLAERRTKEIGIRKVLGSSVSSLIYLLSIDFIKLVLVANIIAVPIAWLIMNKWLQNYAYHMTMGPWLFLFTALITFGIAFFTVGSQTFKAANSNPVKALKWE
jgi:putative ABC transport system permease protein